MTHILNAPETFRADFLRGYLAAHPTLEQVADASAIIDPACRATGKVSVVTGGGGGHFPAFAGFVGTGMATAAALGEVFTSPSAEQVYRTIRAADCGAGVVVCIGNYSGDRMNFGLAAQRAQRDGTDARIVTFSDDIAAGRGIAGGFFVVRGLAAAADERAPLDAVEAAGNHVDRRTRSLGVAFGGCRLPGAATPLFDVGAGTMGIGLGIHGEAGVASGNVPAAAELAELLVDRVLAERPQGVREDRCSVLVNGLGATGLEELYVLAGEVLGSLAARGVHVDDTHVGQVVTSLDMPGCSLSLCWTDEDIRRWLSSTISTTAISNQP